MTQYSAYVGELVGDVRRDTQNAADIPTAVSQRGVQTKDIVRYLNYAQYSLERQITSLYPFVFQASVTLNIVGGQALQPYVDNTYLGVRIKKVEYSYDGAERNYIQLIKQENEDVSYVLGRPQYWSRNNYGIELQPVPSVSQGGLRITYQRTLDSMAIRAGQITAVTVAAGNVTAITVNTATDEPELFTDGLTNTTPLCISTSAGLPRAYNIPFSQFNQGTGVITITPAPVLSTTTPPVVGDWVTVGQYTTTHSKLPYSAAEYLVEFASRKLKIRESSPTDWQALDMLAQRIAKEIAEAYAIKDSTARQEIPISGFGANMMRRNWWG